jgi:hypothetical protein
MSTYYSPAPYNSSSTYYWQVYPSTGVSTSYVDENFVLYFTQTGSYTVICRETATCPASDFIELEIQVGNSSYTAKSYHVASGNLKQIYVTPEEAGQTLNSANNTITYTLYSIFTGETAAQGTLPASGGTLDFGNQPSGIYILQINKGNGTPEVHRILLK